MELRLESLDVDAVRRVIAFTGLPASPEVDRAIDEQFKPAGDHHRRQASDPATVAMIEGWIAPTQAWLASSSEVSA